MLALLLVSASAFWGFVAVLYLSPRLRKSTFIAVTYVTLTVWYYYRKVEKKYLPQRRRSISRMPMRAEAMSSEVVESTTVEGSDRGSDMSGNGRNDVVRASEMESSNEISEEPTRLSTSSDEDNAEGPSSGKKSPRFKLGLLKSLHVSRPKSKSVDSTSISSSFLAKLKFEKSSSTVSASALEHRVSSPTMSEAELLIDTSSDAATKARSESTMSSSSIPTTISSSPTRPTRRVFVGRKKPANWAD